MQVPMSSKDDLNVAEDPRTYISNELPVMAHCASCGKSEDENEGKLKTCTACKSVKYCNIDCQRNHRKIHKKECKRIEEQLKAVSRADVAAGLKALSISASKDAKKVEGETNKEEDDKRSQDDDEDMFTQPPKEECPLCLIPLTIREDEISYQSCCGKRICNGCSWKHDQVLAARNAKRALKDPPEPPLEHSCAFCRKPTPTSYEEAIEMVESRMALGDPEAFDCMGGFYEHGNHGLARDERREFELRHRGAELGSANGCYNVSCMYRDGEGVDRDTSKQEHYLKLAAKRGHISARHNLGCLEWKRGNFDVAVKHWVISAAAGHDGSLKHIGTAYRHKYVTKDQYEKAIRANKDAKEEMTSEERDKAKAFLASGR